MDKAAERTNLVYSLGLLLKPVEDAVNSPQPPAAAEFRILAARLGRDLNGWREPASRFTTFGDFRFHEECNGIINPPHDLRNQIAYMAQVVSDDAERQRSLFGYLLGCKQNVLEAINRVPIQFEAQMLGAGTPFSTHLKIFDAINTAKVRMHYFDRYLTWSFFPLYLRELNRSLEVVLVTTRGNGQYGVTNVHAQSQLAAREFTNYRLVECPPTALHDRNLRVDNLVFNLGPSLNAAGTAPTNFNPADSTPNGLSILDGIIAGGTVVP
jgi:hypothetical protein